MRYYHLLFATMVLEILALSAVTTHAYSKGLTGERAKVVDVLGLTDLFLTSDCYSTRTPATIDFSGCFRDLPVQICYHASCTGYSRPQFQSINTTLEVVHGG